MKQRKEGNLHKLIRDLWDSEFFLKDVMKVLEEAKADLMPEKPNVDDYELTIPAQQAQYEIDLERWKKFVRWFGDD